jgi:hypothetical protein
MHTTVRNKFFSNSPRFRFIVHYFRELIDVGGYRGSGRGAWCTAAVHALQNFQFEAADGVRIPTSAWSRTSPFLFSDSSGFRFIVHHLIFVSLSTLVGVNERQTWCVVHLYRCIHTPENFQFEAANGVRPPMSACFVRSEAFFLSDILGFGLKRRR